MKFHKAMYLAVILALITPATEAVAQLSGRPMMTRGDRWEFSVQTRYTWSKDVTGEQGSSLSVGEDLGWGFGFAYNFNQRFNLGMIFAWRTVPYEATALSVENPGETYRYSGQMTTSTFGAIGEYNILKGKFTPYVSGQWAWFHINTNIFAGWGSGCWWDPIWGYVCGAVPYTYGLSTSVYGLGAGVRYDFNDKVFMKAGYEHGWISAGSVDGNDIMRIDIGFLF